MERRGFALIKVVKRKRMSSRVLCSTDKDFIISFVKNSPNWEKIGLQKIKDFPYIKWKLLN